MWRSSARGAVACVLFVASAAWADPGDILELPKPVCLSRSAAISVFSSEPRNLAPHIRMGYVVDSDLPPITLELWANEAESGNWVLLALTSSSRLCLILSGVRFSHIKAGELYDGIDIR